jgi:hypothetical protein
MLWKKISMVYTFKHNYAQIIMVRVQVLPKKSSKCGGQLLIECRNNGMGTFTKTRNG